MRFRQRMLAHSAFSRMKCRFMSLVLAIGAVSSFPFVEFTSAQSAAQSPDAAQSGVVLIKLAQLRYPPLARQARIQGDVKITVGIRRDGSVESAVIASGHPMLMEAALESARNSQYECRGCSEAITSSSLVYSFQLDFPSAVDQSQAPLVTHSGNHVTVGAEPVIISDRPGPPIRVRSAKCLYLWKCGGLHYPTTP